MTDTGPNGTTTTTTTPAAGGGTTVVNTGSGGGGGGAYGNIGGALIGLAVLLAVVLVGWFLIQANHRAEVRGDAVTSAAHAVGSAARKAGAAITP